MSAEELIEPFAVQEVFVDGWGDRVLSEGIYSSAGYRIIRGEKVVVIRIAQRASTVRKAVTETGEIVAQQVPVLVILEKALG